MAKDESNAEDSPNAGPPEPSPDESTKTVHPDVQTRTPKRIGHYHVKRVLASGGMGTVYEATQEKPRRTVALKLMRHGIASRSALRRFEYESQILARLRHPGIAQVYEAGTHRDDSGTVPFFAMEYIVGAKPITQYVKEKKLGTREGMELFAQVCDAVNHGHQKGIIHRDLKPSNILVDAQGQVKIIDFGVARSTDSDMAVTTLQTDIGQLIGTLQYMSPEQCEADPHNIDTRSDVYALGVVFYELLCGKLPYDVTRVAMHEATRIIREQHPTKLSTLNKTVRGDVETIALKALEKDRERRYQSATDFAQDIRRYLGNEAIIARPPSIVYQLRVFARRNKAAFGAIAAVFVVLAAGLIVSLSLYAKAERARADTEIERDRALQAEEMATAVNEFLIDDMLASADPEIAQGRKLTVEEVLGNAAKKIDAAFPDRPEIEASIRTTIGETYVGLGLYEPAEVHLREAGTIRERRLGDEHPDTLRTHAVMADLFRRQGWFLKAESLALQTLEGQRRVLGKDHLATAFTLNALGLVQRRQGKYDQAESAFRQALEIRRSTLGEGHPDTLMSMSNLADLLGYLGRCDEAEVLHRDVLQARRRHLGDEHPRTLASLSGLGVVLRCQGKRDEAETNFREAIDLKRRVLGEEHPDTLQSIYDLAVLLFVSGRLDEAEELFKRTLEARRRVLGIAHLSVASNTDWLLRVLRARGRVEEAGVYVDRLLAEDYDEVRRDDMQANPYEVNAYAYAQVTYEPVEFRNPAEALRNSEKLVERTGGTPSQLRTLSIAYQQCERIDEAIETERRALTRLEPGDFYWRTMFETRLIHLLRVKGDPGDAEAVLSDALVQTPEPGAGPRSGKAKLVRKMMDLAVFLVAEDRYLQHEWFCADLALVRGGTIPTDEPGIAGFVVIYASALVEQKRYAESEPYLRHCLEIRKLALPEDDWHVAQVMSLLGADLSGQGKLDEAEPLLLDAYNQMKDNAETIPEYYRDERIREALERIIKLYESWGKPDKAAKYRAALSEQESTEPTEPEAKALP